MIYPLKKAMHDIKTYNRVVYGNGEVSFRISRMEEIWEARKGVGDDPHRPEIGFS